MSWLDALSGALTAGSQGVAGWLQGQQKAQAAAQAQAKELYEALRQKRLDEQQQLMQQAQMQRWAAEDERAKEEQAYRKRLEERQGTKDVMEALESGYREAAPYRATGSLLDEPLRQIVEQQNAGAITLGGKKLVSPLESKRAREERIRAENIFREEQKTAEERAFQLQKLGTEHKYRTQELELKGRLEGSGQQLSPAIQKAIADNNKQLYMVETAINLTKARPQSFGLSFGASMIPWLGPTIADPLNQRADPEGVPARSAVANVSSLEIKDRSGAAVTVNEFPRLMPFIPQIHDSPEKILTNLKQLKSLIEAHNRALATGNYYSPDVLERGAPQENGFPPEITGGTVSPVAPTQPMTGWGKGNEFRGSSGRSYNLRRP